MKTNSYTKIDNDLMRNVDNNKPDTLMELGLLTYLKSHKEGYKITQTFICRTYHIDSRTLKKVIINLNKKGFSKEISIIENVEEVLLNNKSTIVKLQDKPLLNNNTKKNKRRPIEKEKSKKEKVTTEDGITLPIEKAVIPLTVASKVIQTKAKELVKKQQATKPATQKPIKTKVVATFASLLPEIIPKEYVELGLKVNPNIDIEAEYRDFRSFSVIKNRKRKDWLKEFNKWLQTGIEKYNKGVQIEMTMVEQTQEVDSVFKNPAKSKEELLMELKQIEAEYENVETKLIEETQAMKNKAWELREKGDYKATLEATKLEEQVDAMHWNFTIKQKPSYADKYNAIQSELHKYRIDGLTQEQARKIRKTNFDDYLRERG